MGHLDGRQPADMDRGGVLVLLDKFVLQSHDAPDAAAEQTVELRRIFLGDGHVLDAEVGKLRLIGVLFHVQPDGYLVDNGVRAALAQHGKYLLRLVRANVVVGKNALDGVDALGNDLRVVRAAILPEQELQHVYRHVRALFYLLGQVLADDSPVKELPQLAVDFGVPVVRLLHDGLFFHFLSFPLTGQSRSRRQGRRRCGTRLPAYRCRLQSPDDRAFSRHTPRLSG